jgi:DNA-directed RNA polymerase subunit alpha
MPKSLTKDEASATETYAKFIAEPFEAGYGRTVGNSLRRVLLSSLEGAAITSIRITGAQHEFATLTGIVEDVTDIVLNLKKIKFKAVDHQPRTVTINVNKEGSDYGRGYSDDPGDRSAQYEPSNLHSRQEAKI